MNINNLITNFAINFAALVFLEITNYGIKQLRKASSDVGKEIMITNEEAINKLNSTSPLDDFLRN